MSEEKKQEEKNNSSEVIDEFSTRAMVSIKMNSFLRWKYSTRDNHLYQPIFS